MNSLLGPKGRISVLVVLALGIAVGLTLYVEKASARYLDGANEVERGTGHTRYFLLSSGSVADTTPPSTSSSSSFHLIGKRTASDTLDVNVTNADNCGLKHNGTTWVSDTNFLAANSNRWYMGHTALVLHPTDDGKIPPNAYYFFNSTDQNTHGSMKNGKRLASATFLDDSDTSTSAKQCKEVVNGQTWYFFKYAAVEQ